MLLSYLSKATVSLRDAYKCVKNASSPRRGLSADDGSFRLPMSPTLSKDEAFGKTD